MNEKGNCATVEPIRDINELNSIKEYLYDHNRKIHLLFILGINTGTRVSDLLKFTVEDVKNIIVTIREQKTGKTKQFELSDTCIKAIKEYIEYAKLSTGLLFPNKEGSNTPVTKQWVWKVLNKAADYCGIKENIGTHTMRKTFGWHAWRSGVDIGYLQACFNHSSKAVTMSYLGITQDELNEKVYRNMNL